MSYRGEGEQPAGGKLLKKLGGILAFVFAVVLAKAVVSGGFDLVDRQTTTAASIEREIESDDQLAELYAPLRQYFPDEYRALTSRVAEMVRARESESAIYRHVYDYSRSFVLARSRDIAAAPSVTLLQIAQTHADVARALSNESPTACAQFGFEGMEAETARGLSPATASRLRTAAPLMFKAAYEGKSNPVVRSAELNEAHANTLIGAVKRRGLSESEIDSLFAGEADRLDVLTKCRMTVALYGGVADLPRDVAAHVTAILFSAGTESEPSGS